MTFKNGVSNIQKENIKTGHLPGCDITVATSNLKVPSTFPERRKCLCKTYTNRVDKKKGKERHDKSAPHC